jgi:hypothetical protein
MAADHIWRDPAVRELADLRDAIACYLDDLDHELVRLRRDENHIPEPTSGLVRNQLVLASGAMTVAATHVLDALRAAD